MGKEECRHSKHSDPHSFAPSFIHSFIPQMMLICGPDWIQTVPTSPVFLETVSRAPDLVARDTTRLTLTFRVLDSK